MIDVKKSKLKQDLLILFLSNQNKEFYLRQIERKTGHSVGNIRKELIAMERDELFLKRKKSNRVYYRINNEYRYFDEIKRDLVKHSSPGQILATMSDLAENFIEIYKKDAGNNIPPYDFIFVGNTGRKQVEKYLDRVKEWTNYTWGYSFIRPDDNKYLIIKTDPKTSLVWKKDK